MKLAYNQAGKVLGNTGKNPAVGCVIVKNNTLISLAHTHFNGRPHAESIALSRKKINFKDSLLYSTLEPCSHYGKTSPCTDIIKKRNIKSVYFSKFDPDRRSFGKAKKKSSPEPSPSNHERSRGSTTGSTATSTKENSGVCSATEPFTKQKHACPPRAEQK